MLFAQTLLNTHNYAITIKQNFYNWVFCKPNLRRSHRTTNIHYQEEGMMEGMMLKAKGEKKKKDQNK